MLNKTLIFIPTYNEIGNVEMLISEIMSLGLKGTDILFIDDNSPDGTGKLLDDISIKNKNVAVIHRLNKLGIGSAHKKAIRWAYKRGYTTLITMDCDFTHQPADILRLLRCINKADVVLGSRFKKKNSMEGWSKLRTFMSKGGYLLAKILFGIDYDSSNALRAYNLSYISPKVFSLIKSNGYSFFIESLVILNYNNYKIMEIGVKLPARKVGRSKTNPLSVYNKLMFLFTLYLQLIVDKDRVNLTNGKKHTS